MRFFSYNGLKKKSGEKVSKDIVMRLECFFRFDACSYWSLLGFVVDQKLESYLVDSS